MFYILILLWLESVGNWKTYKINTTTNKKNKNNNNNKIKVYIWIQYVKGNNRRLKTFEGFILGYWKLSRYNNTQSNKIKSNKIINKA